MRNVLRLLCFILVAGVTGPALAAPAPPTVPGQLVLKLRPGQPLAALEVALRTLDAGSPRQKCPRAQAPSA